MTSEPVLLCYGHDETLLETRRLILRESGRVLKAESLAEVARLRDERNVKLVIVCHSVENAECNRLVQISQAIWPKVEILMLHSLYKGCAQVTPHHEVEVMDGPGRLKTKVCALLRDAEGE